VVEVDGKRIMTDPGSYTTAQLGEKNIDIILITHEHGDHVHVESLKKVLENNPGCKIVTNSSVKKILDEENISAEILEDGELDHGVKLYAETCEHVDIYDTVPVVQNTGYMIAEKLFYPGDAWLVPKKSVEVLALPCGGPWWKVRDAVEYAKAVRPKIFFNIHDAMLKPTEHSMNYMLPKKVLGEMGSDFKYLSDGDTIEI
jgi:L-ascorbate metabolism protein UlaG (beta-lactamase superfamily)